MADFASPKKGSNIICRVSNATPEMVCSYVSRLPKSKMTEEAFRKLMGKKWFSNEHQAPEQWGLYYIDGEYYYPRFNRDITITEAEQYLFGWMKRLIVINPYTSFRRTSNDNRLVESIVKQLENNPNEHDLKTILARIINSEEPFVVNEIIANALNNYSEVLSVKTINKDEEEFEVKLLPNYKEILKTKYNMTKKEYFDLFNDIKLTNHNNDPRQQIFYGAPGTGKSHEIKKLTKGESVIRTTFHPDSDYSTFVGAYKPTMENSEVRVVPVVVNNGISLDQSNGTYWEKKIVYKFVKQAFLKAYLAAWKKMADAIITTNVNTFTVGGNTFTLTAIDDDKVTYSSSFSLTKKGVQNVWNKLWSNGSFIIPTGQQSGESSEQAVCKWIYENTENCAKDCFDAGWDKLKNELATHSIDVDTGKGKTDSEPKQIYTISLGNTDNDIQITTKDNTKDKTRIKECYTGDSKPVGVEKGLVDSLKELDPDSFDGAWEKLKNKTNDTIVTVEPQFLIIEEINRGNCAQIFGDLFQLLDRSDNNFSEYPIEADTDLQQEIERAFNEPGEYRIDNDINVDGVVENYTSNYNASLSEDIQHGRILLLPSNLYIWATMNTSDQSLFPIDSAFKRRWEWKYIKIAEGRDEATRELLNWTVKFDYKEDDKPFTFECSWWDFIKAINEKIAEATSSDDKKLGYFFCKPKDKNSTTIDEERFVGKVVFYLWNDVFKDEENPIFKVNEGKGEPSFDAFYKEDEAGKTIVDTAALRKFMHNVFSENKDQYTETEKSEE